MNGPQRFTRIQSGDVIPVEEAEANGWFVARSFTLQPEFEVLGDEPPQSDADEASI